MSKKIKFTLFTIVLVSVAIAVRYSPLAEFVTKEHAVSFLESIRSEWWGPMVFVLIYSVGCVVALPGSILTLAGGAVFGTLWGTIYNLIATNIGASLAFFTARYFGRDFVKALIKDGKFAKLDQKIGKSGFKTILRLRLIPLVPFNGLNFGAAFSSIRYSDYLAASLIGMIPGTFIYTYFADSLVQGVEGASEKAFLNLLVAGTLLILISFLPAVYKKIKGVNAHESV